MGAFVAEMYQRLPAEIESGPYQSADRELFADPYYYARYLDPRTRPYILDGLRRNVGAAATFMGLDGARSREVSIMDLGCGVGMQSYIFAALGARVVGYDMNPECISLCTRRRAYLEDSLGKPLDAEFVTADFRKFDPASVQEPFDCFFSMSAFAYIPPLESTVERIVRCLKADAKVFIWDINPSYMFLDVFSSKRRALPGPAAVAQAFAAWGFKVVRLEGATGLPRQAWRMLGSERWASGLDSVLRSSMRLSFNYILGASRTEAAG